MGDRALTPSRSSSILYLILGLQSAILTIREALNMINGSHNSVPIFKSILGHPNWVACSDGHIYEKGGQRLVEHRKEAGENRWRVHCRSHGTYHDVARLVAAAFWGLQSGCAVVHRNGNTSDNRPENLRSVSEAGINSHCGSRRKLSRAELSELHLQLESGVPKTRIAVALHTSPRNVRYHSRSCRCGFTPRSPKLL